MPGAASSGIRPGQCLVLRILAGRDDAGPVRGPAGGVVLDTPARPRDGPSPDARRRHRIRLHLRPAGAPRNRPDRR